MCCGKSFVIQSKELHDKGEPLNSWHIQQDDPAFYTAANKYFGSWPKAVEAAGLDYNDIRVVKLRSWSQESIADEIIRRHEAGLSIRGGDVSIEDSAFYQAARHHFGQNGWARARELAGFSPTDPHPHKKWTRATVVEEIRRLHRVEVPLHAAALRKGEYSYIRYKVHKRRPEMRVLR